MKIYGTLTLTIHVLHPARSDHGHERFRKVTVWRTACERDEAESLVRKFQAKNAVKLDRATFVPNEEDIDLFERVEEPPMALRTMGSF